MKSKECLERLLKIAYVEPGPTKEKFITYTREIEHNKKCLDLYNTIKQDLDRLEKLEKENEELREITKIKSEQLEKCINTLFQKNVKLEKENQILIEENIKLKNVIEIIKNKIVIINALKLSKDLDDYNRMSSFEVLTQEEYELLKEVL